MKKTKVQPPRKPATALPPVISAGSLQKLREAQPVIVSSPMFLQFIAHLAAQVKTEQSGLRQFEHHQHYASGWQAAVDRFAAAMFEPIYELPNSTIVPTGYANEPDFEPQLT